jgi:phage gpG-like protein
MSDKFRFDLIQKQFKTGSLNAMREIAMANKNFFLKSFREQKWEGKQWQQVKRRIKGTKEYEYPKNKGLRRRTRPILVGKGTLRRAVNASIRQILPAKVTFLVRLPYAAIHNEGLKMKNGQQMPKRQYMGQSKEMHIKNIDIIKKYADKSFRSK